MFGLQSTYCIAQSGAGELRDEQEGLARQQYEPTGAAVPRKHLAVARVVKVKLSSQPYGTYLCHGRQSAVAVPTPERRPARIAEVHTG